MDGIALRHPESGLPGDIHVQRQALTRLQVFALGQGIPAPQAADGDIEFLRNAREGIALAHAVVNLFMKILN